MVRDPVSHPAERHGRAFLGPGVVHDAKCGAISNHIRTLVVVRALETVTFQDAGAVSIRKGTPFMTEIIPITDHPRLLWCPCTFLSFQDCRHDTFALDIVEATVSSTH